MSRIEMTRDEIDEFLGQNLTLHMATLTDDGWPAVVPVWFVWHDSAFWVWNLDRAKRTERLRNGTRVSVTVDDGVRYHELRGIMARVNYAFVQFPDSPAEVRALFAQRYLQDGAELVDRGDHTWIHLVPRGRIRSWDFRKIAPRT